MAADKQAELDRIEADIKRDNVCPDLAGTATQLVFGAGNPDAELVFIGEAPGKNEDIQGKPFVGAAGKFLNEMLATIGLERQDIYITNIVKYRPPNNRDPRPDEKAAFLPYLQAQLDVIQPLLVITLGRHSLNCFLPDLQIGAVHGQPQRVHIQRHRLVGEQQADSGQGVTEKRTEPYKSTAKGVSQATTQSDAAKLDRVSGSAGKQDEQVLVILPLFHPAAALYNGGMRQTLIDDFSKIPTIKKLIQETQ